MFVKTQIGAHVGPAVFFIIIAVALALGPIMMLRPSTSQKYITKLRAEAAQRGLIVQAYVDTDHASSNLFHYIRRDADLDKSVDWSLMKLGYEHEAHFSGAWDWQGRAPESLDSKSEIELGKFVATLGKGIKAIGKNRLGIFLLCSELSLGNDAEQAINLIDAKLDRLQKLLKFGD
jgi:hypothetical protein